MSKWMAYAVGAVAMLSLFVPVPAACQSTLSQNSGINSSDTWVVFDMTLQTQATINTQNAYYNAQTQTTSNQMTITRPTETLHVELGYDSNGGLVANVWPKATSQPDAPDVSVIRFANGQVTAFDAAGNPIPLQLPNSSVATLNAFNMLGANPGPSVINTLVVPNIDTFASSENATIIRSYYSAGAQYQPAAGTSMVDLSVPATAYETQNSTWTYYLSNGYWIANCVSSHPKISSGTATQTIYYQNLAYYDNSSADSTRASKGNTAQTPPPPSNGTPGGLSLASQSSTPTQINNLGGSQNVAFVHGLLSNSSTWSRMTGWLNQNFLFGTEAVPTLDSTASLSSQTTNFDSILQSAGGSNYLLIGHSDGGLVSRAAAQYYQSLGRNTAIGVATVDSPNTGALLAFNAYALVDEVMADAALNLWEDAGCFTAYDNWACYVAALTAAGAAGYFGDWAFSQALPATADIIPGSAFLNQLNSFHENFTEAGIVSYTPERWAFMRILANGAFGCNPEDACGERAFAAYTEVFYDALYVAEAIAFVEGDYDLEEYLITIQYDMDVADSTWNTLVDPFQQGSDAIVQSPGQYYPSNNAAQYVISPADSHTGSTRSDHVRDSLYTALVQTFKVPTQASCSFSASPSTFDVSSSGGSSSFSLNTAAGCKWSAVSQADWISITSGSSGTSSSTISFTVNQNPASVPRNGAIIVRNGSSTATFTVTEYGVCSYYLSVYTVGMPSGGGNATVDVYAQSWCPWSAVPNSPWLNVTSGTSGTGNGSFTVSAAANSGNTSLVGTVTVMDQTLTVILGDPVGAPSSGSVTISGTWHLGYDCPPGCREKSCCTPIYESGSVTVTIGGDSYSAYYSGTESAGQLASALATQINAGSLVSATVSGSTITLIAKEDGVGTNYSLSSSYTYDTTHFSSPAFTASLSGSAMTGGTD